MNVLTHELALSLMGTGSEVTAQNVDDNNTELMLGVGDTAYMYKADAERLLSADEFQGSTPSKNPLFIHLDNETLFHLLRREYYVITE